MKIKKLQLKNGYKRFHDLTIDLGEDPKKIIALVGPNGCGKSSVLDGLLFHHNAHGQIGGSGGKGYTYHSMLNDPNYNYQNVIIDFVEGGYDYVWQQKQKIGKEKAIFSFRSPYRYNSDLNISEVRSTGEIRLNNYGASTSSDIDSKIEMNYRRIYGAVNKFMNEQDCRPSEAKEKIIGDLNKSIKKCIDAEISSIGNVEESKGSLYFKKKDHPYDFNFNVLSSGEKEVIDILLDLYLRKDDYSDTIFLLDEPELHINTSIQKNLLIEIDRLIGESCQIWIATHSIGFLRTLQSEMRDKCQIIQFQPNFELASKPYTLVSMKPTITNWRETFSVALDDLTQLVSPRQIIYCEGRAEPGLHGVERGMDAKAFNNIFSAKYPETLFISSGGNTELDQRSAVAISIINKIFVDVKILVLKDRDMASGKFTDEADRQTYLENNLQNHRVLKRWEIENYLYDKEVLLNYCSKRNLSFDENAYNNLVTDIVNQDLKIETAKIKNICGLKINVNAEVFKIALSEYITEEMAVYAELEACVFQRA